MGDPKSTLEKARKELEDMYLGIPDDSVNLTFQDFVQVKKAIPAVNNVLDVKVARQGSSLLANKSPSFSRDLAQGSYGPPSPMVKRNGEGNVGYGGIMGSAQVHGSDRGMGMIMEDHDMSGVSGVYREVGGGPRRAGIPHSNICTICSTYIYVFRHRCLVCNGTRVCGRVYCRNCVAIGMGEMTEGRKCLDCLGRRFSQRYIGRAGKMGCCGTWGWRYSNMVKQAEANWAEKGARRSNRDHPRGGGSVMMSRSMAAAGGGHHQNIGMPSIINHSNPPSFVLTNTTSSAAHSPFSTPTHHHLPF